jgi:hypothetical protein
MLCVDRARIVAGVLYGWRHLVGMRRLLRDIAPVPLADRVLGGVSLGLGLCGVLGLLSLPWWPWPLAFYDAIPPLPRPLAFVAEIGWWIVLVLGGLSLLLYFMEVWEYGGAWVAVMYFLGMASVFILCGLLGRFLRMLICG